MCYFNRLTRVARWLADYPEWLQFCRDFVKPPRNDEIALQHFFFLLAAVQEYFCISFVLHAIFFFQQALAGIFFQYRREESIFPQRLKHVAEATMHSYFHSCK